MFPKIVCSHFGIMFSQNYFRRLIIEYGYFCAEPCRGMWCGPRSQKLCEGRLPLGVTSASPGVNGKTNVFLIVFDGIALSCSVALKLLGTSSA